MAQFVDESASVFITRMKQVDDLDPFFLGTRSDFFSRVTIDGKRFSGRRFEENDNLSPGTAWLFSNDMGQGNGFVPIKIEIFEDDNNGDTRVDINPLAGKKDLNLVLNMNTGEILSTESGVTQVLGSVNQSITLRGAGDRDRGEITFFINGLGGDQPANSVIIQNPFVAETPETNDQLGAKANSGNSPLVAGDFNADGRTDLVVGSLTERVAHIINGTSTGLDQSRLQTTLNTNALGGATINGSAFAVGDINGDRVDDLILGGETTVVRFGRAGSGLSTFSQNNIVKDARFTGSNFFGTTVTAGDFNGDGRDDVVVGDPFATTAGQTGSGTIQVNYGSSAGITSTNRQVFHRDTPGILGLTTANANFGRAMATGDINGDGFEDLVVGAPGATDVASNSGAVNILYGSASGLTTTNSQQLGQSFSGVTDQNGDGFGSAIAVADVNGDRVSDVIVAAPGRTGGAGQLYVYHGRRGQLLPTTASRIFTQANLVNDPVESGDRFGATLDAKDMNNDGFADLVVGSPGEGSSTGLAHMVFGSSVGLTSTNARFLAQGIGDTAGTSDTGDLFGTGIAIGNFNGSGSLEIAISAPGEDFGTVEGAGLVNIVPSVLSPSSFSLSEIDSTQVGTNSSETLQGADANGILDGRGGSDRIFTSAGHDVAMGGTGNDVLNAGKGDDLLDGGKGRDTYKGGKGRDIFVLAPEAGPDLIQDFQVGKDYLGLAQGLQFDSLELIQRGSSTVVKANGDRLATLQGVEATLLSVQDVVQIDFTRSKGMAVPTVVI